MKKIIIYSSETCPYCKQVKEEFEKNKFKFEEKLVVDHQEEWSKVTNLTGLGIMPTIYYEDTYFVPQRDFGNVQGLVEILQKFKPIDYSETRQILERTKTLNFNIFQGFQRLDTLLRDVESKLNTEEDEHKSNN